MLAVAAEFRVGVPLLRVDVVGRVDHRKCWPASCNVDASGDANGEWHTQSENITETADQGPPASAIPLVTVTTGSPKS